MARIKLELEKFRSRWLRWLGQMTRRDRDTWVELLDCNWSEWPNQVHERVKSPHVAYPIICQSSRKDDVHYTYEAAINEATMKELRKLDAIYCQKVLLRGK